MVRLNQLLLLFLLAPCLLWAATPRVTAEIEPNIHTEEKQLEGKISIVREAAQKVDERTFQLGNHPLTVQFLYDSMLSADEHTLYPDFGKDAVVSLYRFLIPSQPKGLYILPEVSVEISGVRYRSIPSSYEVTTEQAGASLHLEGGLEGSQPLYPGQRAQFFYRITYNQATELNREQLPLLDATGFEKIGGKQVKDFESGGFMIEEIHQEVRAISPGSYHFDGSLIEGRAFRDGPNGQRIYGETLLSSEMPPVTVDVKPFPKKNQPLSFTGAMGTLNLDVQLLSSPQVAVGDTLQLSIKLTGSNDPESLKLPQLACQPGFAGFFDIEDFPPAEKMDGTTKEFIVLLRPLSPHITHIPAVQFAVFEPAMQYYQILKGPEIPITVAQAKPTETMLVQREKEPAISSGEWRAWLDKPERNPLPIIAVSSPKALTRPIPSVSHWLMATLICALLLGVQWILLQVWKRRLQKPRQVTSLDDLRLAKKSVQDTSRLYMNVERALLKRLSELNLVPPHIMSPDRLPDKGAAGDVKTLLLAAQARLFGGGSLQPQEFLTRAEQLYRKLAEGR